MREITLTCSFTETQRPTAAYANAQLVAQTKQVKVISRLYCSTPGTVSRAAQVELGERGMWGIRCLDSPGTSCQGLRRNAP